MKIFSIIILCFLVSHTYSITPPDKGKFPAKMIKFLKENPDFISYGNPGWLKKIQNIKSTKYHDLHKTAAVQATFNLPVLLGSFSDAPGIINSSAFQDLLFGENTTGNLGEYYNEISYGNFSLSGQVYGWYTADQNFAFYTGDDNGYNGSFPQNVRGFIVNIVSKSDGAVDYGQYDNDGPDGVPNSGDDDGYADAVCIVYAGAGAEWSPGNDSFWPHTSNLADQEYQSNDAANTNSNGFSFIRVSTYFVCPEESGGGDGDGQIRPIGVFAHEFGHVLGLPDLYDRTASGDLPDQDDSEGIGEWCLMAGGSWGGDGQHSETPSHMSAWCKYKLGWLEPSIVTDIVNGITVNQAETNARALLLWEDSYALDKYFLIENRQKIGFDQYLNGDGILIYHIDETRNLPWNGFQNDDETHKLVDIEEADGLANLDNAVNRGDEGDTYPGSSSNRTFTDFTTPSALDYQSQMTGISVTNISASSAIMTMNIKPRRLSGYSIFYDEEGYSGRGLGYGEPARPETYAGVLFQSGLEGVLESVDVGFMEQGMNYTLKIYNNFNSGSPSNQFLSQSGSSSNAGWNSISLDATVNLAANQVFFISVMYSNESFPVAFDDRGPVSGNSYTSTNGTGFSAVAFGDINIRAKITVDAVDKVENSELATLTEFTLLQNYPNPFNPLTRVSFYLPQKNHVLLKIYNINGQEMLTLLDDQKNAGNHSIVFNGAKLSSGIYLYKLEAGNFSAVRKMILVK